MKKVIAAGFYDCPVCHRHMLSPEHAAAGNCEPGPVCDRPEACIELDAYGDCIDCGRSPACHDY
jgi:hypothetical protein